MRCFMTRMSRAFSPSFLGASFFDFAGHENFSEGANSCLRSPSSLSLLTFEQDKFTSSLLAEQKESGGRGRDRPLCLPSYLIMRYMAFAVVRGSCCNISSQNAEAAERGGGRDGCSMRLVMVLMVGWLASLAVGVSKFIH